jgi:hypothetical protein
MQVEIIGVHDEPDAEEPCHLIEVEIREATEAVDLGRFTQPQPGRPEGDWQAPWDERFLDPLGRQVVADNLHPPDESYWHGTARIAFFLHYLDVNGQLRSPVGEIPLPRPSPKPDRLKQVTYEPL